MVDLGMLAVAYVLVLAGLMSVTVASMESGSENASFWFVLLMLAVGAFLLVVGIAMAITALGLVG